MAGLYEVRKSDETLQHSFNIPKKVEQHETIRVPLAYNYYIIVRVATAMWYNVQSCTRRHNSKWVHTPPPNDR